MSNIVCCIFFGILIIFGISDIAEFILMRLFNFENAENEKLTPETIEYVLRSTVIQNSIKKCKNPKKISPKEINTEELKKMYLILCTDYPELIF